MMYYWKKLDTLSDESSNVSGIAPVNSNEVISNNVDQNFPSKRFFSPITFVWEMFMITTIISWWAHLRVECLSMHPVWKDWRIAVIVYIIHTAELVRWSVMPDIRRYIREWKRSTDAVFTKESRKYCLRNCMKMISRPYKFWSPGVSKREKENEEFEKSFYFCDDQSDTYFRDQTAMWSNGVCQNHYIWYGR